MISGILAAIKAFFGFGTGVADVVGKVQDNRRDAANRDLGASSQKGRTDAEELQALRDDRARSANDELRERTEADHGIERLP